MKYNSFIIRRFTIFLIICFLFKFSDAQKYPPLYESYLSIIEVSHYNDTILTKFNDSISIKLKYSRCGGIPLNGQTFYLIAFLEKNERNILGNAKKILNNSSELIILDSMELQSDYMIIMQDYMNKFKTRELAEKIIETGNMGKYSGKHRYYNEKFKIAAVILDKNTEILHYEFSQVLPYNFTVSLMKDSVYKDYYYYIYINSCK
jgi:hypothetical protein